MNRKIVFAGQIQWRYRYKLIPFALKTLWMALHGYRPTVIE